jgi:hypothetical protein
MKNKKGGWVWLLGVIAVGLILGFSILQMIQVANHMVPIYVATQDIPVDQIIKKADFDSYFTKVQRTQSTVPADAIKDPNQVFEKYSATRILKDQILQQGAVSDARTMREVIRRFGLDFVGMSIPLENTDFPIEQIHAGDVVDIIGTFNDHQVITSKYVAQQIPVTGVIKEGNRVIVAVPRLDAVELSRNLAAGKIRLVLDPHAFPETNTVTEGGNGAASSAGPAPK